MISLPEFVARYTGKPVDVDGAYGNQCMDLLHRYTIDCLGLDRGALAAPTAIASFTNYNSSDPFTKILNTPSGFPVPGDIVYFKKYGSLYGDAGHVAIVTSADLKTIHVFEQNYPTGALCRQGDHSYLGCVGWLHFKGELMSTMFTLPSGNQVDLANPDSMKVCATTWDEVVNQVLWIKKAIADDQCQLKLNDQAAQAKVLQGTIDAQNSTFEQLAEIFKCTSNPTDLLANANLIPTLESQVGDANKVIDQMKMDHEKEKTDLLKQITNLRLQITDMQNDLESVKQQAVDLAKQVVAMQEADKKLSWFSRTLKAILQSIHK